MATVAELLVKIGADSQGLRKEIAASQRQLKRAFGPGALELSEGAAGLMGALAVAMGAVGIASVKMSSDFAASKTAFTQLLGSADKATTMLNDLAVFAADTPFELPGLIKASQKLLAFQFAGEDIIPIMAAVGNAISLVGGGQEAIDGVVRALGQIQAKGKLSAEEMNQLAERGINGWKYIADSMGISVAEVMALCEKGAIDSTTAINAVVLGMQSNFKGGMDAMSKTVPGLLSTIKDNVGMVMREIGDKITVGLDLQGVLQKTADYLGSFSNAVKSAGIKEAILGLVPPEATAAVFALGGALVAVAIPAMYGFAASLLAAMAPMAPYIALGTAIGLLAYEIWKNWDPLSDLFAGMWNTIVNSTTIFLNYLQSAFYSAVSKVMGYLTPLANLFGGSFQSTISNWADNASNKLDQLSASSKDASTKLQSNIGVMQNAWNKAYIGMKSLDISSLVPSAAPKPNQTFTGLHSTQQPGAMGKGNSKAATEAAQVVKAEADYEIDIEKNKAKLILALIKDQEAELDRQRKNGLSGIREYWSKRQKEDSAGLATIQAYWDKRTALETSGVQAELDALNAEKSALETQISQTSDPSDSIGLKKKMLDLTTNITLKERELGEVIKKNSALAATESVGFIEKYASLLEDTQKSIENISTNNKISGLFGSEKDLAEMDKEKSDRIKAVDDVVKAWEKGSAEIKDSYGVAITDTIGIDKWRAEQVEKIRKQSDDKRNQYYASAKDVQSKIDAAYQQNSMSMLQKALTEQNAVRLNDYSAQKSMMDTYQAAYLAAHSTTAQLVSDMYAGAFSGLQSSISGVLQGTESINEAFSALGQTMLKVVADYIAKWLAGKIMMSIFGKTTMAAETAASVAAGAATAAAWAPAAAMVSLASFGANAAPAMAGIGATTALSVGLASVPALATGGMTTGPSLALIGEGHYDEAVLPLNKKAFEKVGIGGDSGGSQVNSLQLNISALDGKSVEKWLLGGGGKMISKYLNNKAKSFALGV